MEQRLAPLTGRSAWLACALRGFAWLALTLAVGRTVSRCCRAFMGGGILPFSGRHG